MGTETNKATMRRWLDEGWCKGNVDAADELIAGDFALHGAGGQVIQSGRQGVKDLVRDWRRAFPDGQMQVLDEIAEGELVGVRLLWTGTHLGPLYGVPPSGRKVSCVSIGIDRVRDGKIAEGWGELDMLGLMQRIGGMPETQFRVSVDPALEAPTRPGPDPLPVAANKAVVLRFLRMLESGDLPGARDACDAGTYVEHDPDTGALSLDPAIQADVQLRASLPDLTFTPDAERLLGEGDRVVVRGSFSGTHSGLPLFGAPASGKKLVWGGIDIFRVSAGRLTERWRCSDTLSLLQQARASGPYG
ncbi:ester cyclase [Pyxidicoccus caerfyrddinensis]|uniref:ester cyclase n=1 Tax=Pyxidicoccus caerfyrddinensis TaxID=2709663 RepID=UPI0013DBDD06|nr:ester cyclase family protein [Pyxidicoccus caerfyrddinensis]